jgi:hypothetical protein
MLSVNRLNHGILTIPVSSVAVNAIKIISTDSDINCKTVVFFQLYNFFTVISFKRMEAFAVVRVI